MDQKIGLVQPQTTDRRPSADETLRGPGCGVGQGALARAHPGDASTYHSADLPSGSAANHVAQGVHQPVHVVVRGAEPEAGPQQPRRPAPAPGRGGAAGEPAGQRVRAELTGTRASRPRRRGARGLLRVRNGRP